MAVTRRVIEPRLRKIGVLGSVESAGEQAEVLAELASATDGDTLEVDFYDADWLAPGLIESLAQSLDRGVRLKIVTYHSLLGHSLMRLGFTVHQVTAKPANRPFAGCKAIAMGGSANSLSVILEIVAQLPLSDCVLFIAQHVSEDQPNLLDRLLQVRTNYRVLMPHHLVPIEPGTIYVAPPGHHMKVSQGLIYLTHDRKMQFARPSIDILFESLAHEYGDQALGILLCGYGRDGATGCAALKNVGGLVLVEAPDACADAKTMPEAAIEAGACSHIFRQAAIASVAAAAALGEQAAPNGELLDMFLNALWEQHNYDFRGYQRASLERRLRVLMSQFGLPGFCDFQLAVLSDSALFNRMVAEISVGVTSFFRHPEQFRALRNEVLPYLASFPILKVWSAGCATGEEAYSMAILLDEMGLLTNSRIFATDSNFYLLELAKSGLFPLPSLEASRENYLKSGGLESFDANFQCTTRYLCIRKQLLQNLIFYRHSLAVSAVFNEFQLIVCRNVMIYFDAELQHRIFDCFVRSLHRDGFLVLGPQDGLAHMASLHGFVPAATGSHIYRLTEGAQHGR
jgi:chemotaxis protein methyltransferase CheR